MSSTKKPSFATLPVEILHRIYDELDTETILFSMRCVSKNFYSITNNYNRLRLDFRYMSRSCVRVMARLIDPKNVISLTLSDEEETYGQIQSFLSHFLINQFSQLRSLNLTYISEEDMDEFHKYIKKSSLTTVSISFSDSDSKITKKILTSILSCNTLRTLKFGNGDRTITGMQWPIRCKVENMTILGGCNWDIAYFIISHSLRLRKFVLRYFSKDETDENIAIEPDMKQCDHLTSLSLCVSSEITMDDMELFLALFPKLTYLQLTGQEYGADPSLLDGSRWEHFIETKLPLLNQFEFRLIHFLREIVDYPTVESLIEPFRSPFWLEIKHLIVKCDEEHNKDYRKFHLYSIPASRYEFDYSHQRNRIVNSTLNITDNHQPIIVNTEKLTLDLNQMMTEYMQENTNLTTPYLFQKVTELELLINQEWPINSMKHLSTVVNLLNIQKICLNFRCDCNFTASLDTEMEVLYRQALNLRSIRIMCNNYEDITLLIRDDSEKLMLITRNTIGLKLPCYIKQLDIEIKDLDDAKRILEHSKHLSRVTFRPLCNGEVFAYEINTWLKDMNRNCKCRKDWGDFCNCKCCDSVKAVYLWLDNKYD